jgi:DmsE family decaheme c-type cytochrome
MRLNDLCYECHQGKEGPFVFEHAPVVEDCSLCHSAHGSIPNNLLTVNEPTLCLQCHEFHFHAGLLSPEGEWEVGGSEYENPNGEHSFNAAFTTKCTQCHSQVHGTDLPTQSVPGAGYGLVR